MSAPYTFNFGNNDPLLNYTDVDYQEQLDSQIAKLQRMKEKMSAVRNAPSNEPKRDLWADIEREISSLTDDQKKILATDDVYIGIEQELNFLIQQELINSVKYKVANTKRGNELLEKHLVNLKAKKESIIKESNKEIELFKKFQIAVQANPNLTYAEFIKSIKQE